MEKGINIAKDETLYKVAEQLISTGIAFDIKQFKDDLYNGNGLNAFRQDMHEVQLKRINRYPSLLITGKEGAALYSGYKSYNGLKELLLKEFILKQQFIHTNTW